MEILDKKVFEESSIKYEVIFLSVGDFDQNGHDKKNTSYYCDHVRNEFEYDDCKPIIYIVEREYFNLFLSCSYYSLPDKNTQKQIKEYAKSFNYK